MSELKVIVPVELKEKSKEFMDRVQGLKPKVEVELVPSNLNAIEDAVRDSIQKGAKGAQRGNSSNGIKINVDRKHIQNEIREYQRIAKRLQGQMNASKLTNNSPIGLTRQRLNEEITEYNRLLERLKRRPDAELAGDYKAILSKLKTSISEMKKLLSETDGGLVNFHTEKAEGSIKALKERLQEMRQAIKGIGKDSPEYEGLANSIGEVEKRLKSVSSLHKKLAQEQRSYGMVMPDTYRQFMDEMGSLSTEEAAIERSIKNAQKRKEAEAKAAAKAAQSQKTPELATDRDRAKVTQQIALLKKYQEAIKSVRTTQGSAANKRQGILSGFLQEDINTLEKLQEMLSADGSFLPDDFKEIFSGINSDLQFAREFGKDFGVDFGKFDWTQLNKGMSSFAKNYAEAHKVMSGKKEDAKYTDEEIEKYKRLSEAMAEYSEAQKKYNAALTPIKNAQNAGETVDAEMSEKAVQAKQELINANKKLAKAVQEVTSAQKDSIHTTEQENISQKKLAQAQATVQQKLQRMEWLKTNYSRAFKDSSWAAEYSDILAGLKADDAVNNIQVLSKRLATLEMRARAAGNAGKTFSEAFGDAFAKFGNWFSVSQLFMKIIELSGKAIQNVKAVDAAMTDLKKVTDETEGAYDQYLASATKRSADMSAKITEYISGTNQFARLGYDVDDAQVLGEIATIYAQVGDDIESVEDASGSIIATMKAFGVEADEAMSIVDKFNKAGNNYAVSSGNVGAMLERSAAVLASAGNDINESIAMGTAMAEVNRDAEKSGAALKVLALRLRGAKTELVSMGEDTEDMAESSSKLREQIMALTNIDGKGGFDIMDEDGFKSTYDMVDGIAKAFNQMDESSENAAALLELIAGKNRASDVSGMLKNWDTAKDVYQDMLDAEGSAMEEYRKWQDSIEAKEKKVASNFERLSVNIFDEEVLKVGYDLLNGLLEIVNQIIESAGALPTVLGLGFAALSKIKPDAGIVKVQYAPPSPIGMAA